MLNQNQIRISAKGRADTTFTHATLKVIATRQGPNGLSAKNSVKSVIEAILKAVRDTPEAKVVEDRLVAQLSVAPRMAHTSQGYIQDGYEATYTVSVRADDLQGALTLHDKFTMLDVKAETPVFHTNDPGAELRAFKVAFAAAREKFRAQCEITGRDVAHWEISSWEVEEEQPRGKMMALSAGPETQAGAQPGQATVSLTAVFLFTHR